MSQNIVVKPALCRPEPVFPFSISGIKEVFPGFALGDFALLHGTSVLSLASWLCVKAQLPLQFSGLQTSVIFIDGGNTFRLYQIAQLAQIHHLNPKIVLDNIYISRAFTAYQTAALIKNQLREVIKKYNAKLVVVSDIAGFFLDKDIADDEAQRIFNQLTTYLSNFAMETQTIVLATYPQHLDTERNDHLYSATRSKASVILSLRKKSYARQFVLEKHPYFSLGTAEVQSEGLTLLDFVEANA